MPPYLASGMSEEDVPGLSIVVNSPAAPLVEVTEEWCKGLTGPRHSDLGSACACVSLELHLLVTEITSHGAAMARKEARAT